MYVRFFKPLFDFALSVFLFVLVLPVFITITVLLLFANKGKTFFIQRRPGKNGKIFKIIKFKTMSDLRDEKGEFLPDINRITLVGRFVRKTSLDEIPQLINIIKGEMSFIGPRPLLEEYLPLYNEMQQKRHDVKPGLTGWAQINGRNAISWADKFKYDIYYVENISFRLDIKIILLTVKKVFRSEGINSSTNTTMEKFLGS